MLIESLPAHRIPVVGSCQQPQDWTLATVCLVSLWSLKPDEVHVGGWGKGGWQSRGYYFPPGLGLTMNGTRKGKKAAECMRVTMAMTTTMMMKNN